MMGVVTIFPSLVEAGQEVITRRNKIAGTVKVDGVPAKRVILVVDRLNHCRIATTTSDPVTGDWSISGLPEYTEKTLLVLALDDSGNYNAEVADYITQVMTFDPPVQPSGDLWSPNDCLKVAAWYAADSASDFVIEDGKIKTWKDRSANARDITQDTAINRPVIGEKLNGMDTVSFDAITQRMVSPAVSPVIGSTAVSIFCVWKNIGSYIQPASPASLSNASFARPIMRERTALYAGNSTVVALDLLSNFTNYSLQEICTVKDLAASGQHLCKESVNGFTTVSTIVGSTWSTLNQFICIGARHDFNSRMQGNVAEIIIMDGVLTSDEREKVEGFLVNKYGLNNNLMASHPYRWFAPVK